MNDSNTNSYGSSRRDSLHGVNRALLPCEQSREERQLRREVDILMLYKDIVEAAPDLFTMHTVDPEARFSFVCDSFHQRMNLSPEDDIIGRPLAAIVDVRDAHILHSALLQVLNGNRSSHAVAGGDGAAGSAGGSLVHLRVVCGHGIARRAGMTIAFGSEGLVIVTRIYV